MNNYGVWLDEFEALGMSHTLELTFPDAVCYFGEGKEVRELVVAELGCLINLEGGDEIHHAIPVPYTHRTLPTNREV